LKDGYKPEEILIGIMWSGPHRYDFYNDSAAAMENVNNWIENPTTISGKSGTEHWEIINPGWETKRAKLWYTEFSTHIGALIDTLEYMIFAQMYFEKVGVPYVMMNFMDFFDKWLKSCIEHTDVKFYSELLDKDKFVIPGEYDWMKENFENGLGEDLIHPNEEGHEVFAKKLIIPKLQELYGYK